MKKVVMIEDNEDHAMLIRRAIEDADVSVEHYEDGAKAIASFQKISNPCNRPHLILLDLKLPGIDGFGVLDRVKKMELFSGVPVVMLTTSGRKEEIREAYRLGAMGYVVKPDDFSEMTAKLKRVKEYWFHTVELSENPK